MLKPDVRLVSVCCLVVVSVIHVSSLNNGLARSPPMGWMTWERFRCNIDCKDDPDNCISENLIQAMADRIVEDGYREAGYEYVAIDDCWMSKERDPYGRLVPDPDRFPSGIKALADYVHSKGLKLGIYEDFGKETCGGYPGSEFFMKQDANTFAEWGVDMLKFDGCNSDTGDMSVGYPLMGFFLNKTGRPILYSCSWPAYIGSGPKVQSREQFDLEKLNSYRIFALGGNHLVDALKEIVRDNDDQKELELVQVKLYYGLNNLQAKRVANSHNSKMSTLQLTFQDKVYQARQIYESDPDKLHSDLLTTLGEIEQKEMNADSLSTIKNIASYTGRCWNEFTCLVESFERDNGCSKNIQQKLFRSIQGMNEEMKYRALRKANEESLTASINWVERTKKQQILRDTFCHQVNAPSWEDAQNLYPEHSSQLDKFLNFNITKKNVPVQFIKFCKEAMDEVNIEDSNVIMEDINIDIQITRKGTSINDLRTVRNIVQKHKIEIEKELWKHNSKIVEELEE